VLLGGGTRDAQPRAENNGAVDQSHLPTDTGDMDSSDIPFAWLLPLMLPVVAAFGSIFV
jgi:hypothetical protein